MTHHAEHVESAFCCNTNELAEPGTVHHYGLFVCPNQEARRAPKGLWNSVAAGRVAR